MDYNKALKIFNIKNLKQTTKEELKKKYYKLCLTYHPDKNNDMDAKEKFQEIGLAYELLNSSLSSSCENEIQENYDDILMLFVKNIFKDKYKDIFVSIITLLKTKFDLNSISLIEKLDKDDLMSLYSFLLKYKNVLSISSDILESLQKLIKEKYQNDIIITLNPTINDILNNNVYKLVIEDKTYFVPLWNTEVIFMLDERELIVKCIPDLPSHIIIDNYDLIITLEIPFDKNLLEKSSYTFFIQELEYSILLHDIVIKKEQYYTLKKKGISIPKENIYDITDRGDMIIHILFV
jgi:hypothetical protein